MSETKASPFTSAVVGAIRRLYPESLADKSFDNTGLLLEAPHRPGIRNSVLLTIDLTKAVADEAILRKDSTIITYHPIIFRGLKSLTLANTQQTTLLRLAQEGISVYSPHTAVDAAPGGLNDFLADIVSGDFYRNNVNSRIESSPHTRNVITPIETPPTGCDTAGYGRILRFPTAVPLGILLSRITQGLGNLDAVSVAVPQWIPQGEKHNINISSIGICAGSGGHMLGNLDVDLLFTGELSHHEALAAIEQGRCCITAFHSNSERAFLANVMRPRLLVQLEKMVEQQEIDEMTDRDKSDLAGGFEVAVSKVDRDPFEIIAAGQTGW
ncbi:NIF3 NGG1 interactin-like proteing factor 3-like 1 [Calycina marina]|uniref:NIF3 NGG1 interactin-like proteing factor 3-like 1 n=1 Tax=Calycina marina TaxID=1763456 RepID=A0A9P8CG25_9HELO|nr:NIF3 NGG1 interactin-like proteing factor 3-like 1 [Calycina marina]